MVLVHPSQIRVDAMMLSMLWAHSSNFKLHHLLGWQTECLSCEVKANHQGELSRLYPDKLNLQSLECSRRCEAEWIHQGQVRFKLENVEMRRYGLSMPTRQRLGISIDFAMSLTATTSQMNLKEICFVGRWLELSSITLLFQKKKQLSR